MDVRALRVDGRKPSHAKLEEMRLFDLGRERLTLLCMLLLTALAPEALANQGAPKIPAAEIDQRVIASLPTWRGKNAEIIDSLDLTRPFATEGQWTLVVASVPAARVDAFLQPVDGGALAVCLVAKLTPDCKYTVPRAASSPSWFSTPVDFYSAAVVFAGPNRTLPLLLVKMGGASGGNGSHAIFTQLFAYDRVRNRFESVFHNSTGSNNNQDTRFVEHGRLRGDIIVAEPTRSAPYGYWISVYPWNKDHPYSKFTVHYRSSTHYGDGNPLAVIDSEMPNILKHLGEWKRGELLPLPSQLPSRCTRNVFLRNGEEWCKER